MSRPVHAHAWARHQLADRIPPPRIKPWPLPVRIAVAIICAAGSWWLVFLIVKWIMGR